MRILIPGSRFAATVSAIAVAMLAPFLGAGTAQAASALPTTNAVTQAAAQAQSKPTITVTRPMHVVGIDAAVAKAHGYTVRTNAQGQQYAVKTGSAAVSPANTITYTCGSSWLSYTAIGSRAGTVSTGYAINPAAGVVAEASWEVAVVDNHGTGLVPNTPTTGTLSWGTTEVTHHSVTGYSYAQVVWENSWVVTVEGILCYSGGPWASTILR